MDNAALKAIFFKKYHGEEIQNCIQCGSCSGSCPLAPTEAPMGTTSLPATAGSN